jgi:nanoRNase/pAp phosphatase (c-di-AMP/oligoRNAs hydrolase)
MARSPGVTTREVDKTGGGKSGGQGAPGVKVKEKDKTGGGHSGQGGASLKVNEVNDTKKSDK